MPNKKVTVKAELQDAVKRLCEENRELFLVSLCTTDGFSIHTVAAKKFSGEADKLAAMSSTICALSDSSSKQVLEDEFKITIVESDAGNLLFVKTKYLEMPCVLTIAAKHQLALATARYKTKAFAQEVSKIME